MALHPFVISSSFWSLTAWLLFCPAPAICCTAQSPNGFDKTGPYRARFILEALTDLRSRLRDAGSDLVVRIGKPGEQTKLCRTVQKSRAPSSNASAKEHIRCSRAHLVGRTAPCW